MEKLQRTSSLLLSCRRALGLSIVLGGAWVSVHNLVQWLFMDTTAFPGGRIDENLALLFVALGPLFA